MFGGVRRGGHLLILCNHRCQAIACFDTFILNTLGQAAHELNAHAASAALCERLVLVEWRGRAQIERRSVILQDQHHSTRFQIESQLDAIADRADRVIDEVEDQLFDDEALRAVGVDQVIPIVNSVEEGMRILFPAKAE